VSTEISDRPGVNDGVQGAASIATHSARARQIVVDGWGLAKALQQPNSDGVYASAITGATYWPDPPLLRPRR